MKFQLDTLLETLGKPGKYQLGIFFLLACNYFPLVFNIVIMGFFGYSPKHSCVSDIYGQSGRNGSAVNGSLAPRLDACSSTYFLSGGINKTVTCANDPNSHWEFYTEEREATIVSEWSLVCESKYLSKLAATIYFCGVMVGGLLFGYLADKYGRKPVMLVTLYTPILIGLGTAFSNNYYLYVALRFFMGMFLQGLQTTSYVLVMEMFLPRYRGVAGAMLEVFWGIAVLLVAPIAYLLQNWRYMQLAISLPSILAIAYIWLTPESLRWMILQKKMEPAKALVQKITKFNGLPYPTEQMDAINSHNKISTEAARQFSFFDLLQTREMRKRSLILFYLWFAVAVAYYALLLNMTSLKGNRYLTFFISALVDMVAFIAVVFIVRKCQRRIPLLVFFVIGGVACIIAGIIPFILEDKNLRGEIVTTCAIIGKFGASGVFSLTFLYTSELYPTVIRNIGMGSCAFWARLGGVVAPQILALGDLSHKSISVIIIGVITLVASILLLLLPETMATKLPDTIEEVEDKNGSDNICEDEENEDLMVQKEEQL
ncbi:solute carrier family 22 member 3 [Magallana gigas]|uniref:Major facilitator superfamily (MFS) profile domain-containing protein n=1 Tax=Magallana gigas TaxID=29159 RepID=A0A8W8K121_MAGGI|nr:solute carrier family 22 member 3 isoform X2 [Crassostrea gigas]XP_034339132.1 solute carrier family 22 member 3 isoform X2 [Crassostrea gigas]